MAPLRLLARRVRAFICKEKLDAEMAGESRAHLELQIAENLRRGMAARVGIGATAR